MSICEICGYNESGVGVVVAHALGRGRKVRAGQGKVMANGHREQSSGKCHRKYTADGLLGTGKVEMVR